MKNIYLLLIVALSSCNMSDESYTLPSNYEFEKEGGYCNIVLRDHKLVVDHGAFDFTYNDQYIMFIFDTVSIEHVPRKIDNTELLYLVHDIKKDSLYKRMNFSEYQKFVREKNIKNDDNLSLRNYSKFAE